MSSRDLKRRLATLGIFVAPLILVKATGFLMGSGGPSEAEAAVAAIDPTAPLPHAPTAALTPTEHQYRARTYAASIASESEYRSPFYYGPEADPSTIEPELDETEEPPFAATLGAILGSSSGNTALINGQPHRVGDEVGETGYIVTSIDAHARTVELEHRGNGEVAVLNFERP